jgi:hypothetical protein
MSAVLTVDSVGCGVAKIQNGAVLTVDSVGWRKYKMMSKLVCFSSFFAVILFTPGNVYEYYINY